MAQVEAPESLKVPDVLAVALLLLPGFVSEGVIRYYGNSPQLSEVQTVASALVFTLFNLVIALGLWRLIASRKRQPPALTALLASPVFLALLLAVSLLVGAAWTLADSRDWLFRFPLSARTSRTDVWGKAFQENVVHSKRHTVVTLGDGRVFSGIVRFVSEGETDSAVFIRPAFVELVGEMPQPALLRCTIVGGLLVPKASIQTIAFRDPLKEVIPPCTDLQLAASLRGAKE